MDFIIDFIKNIDAQTAKQILYASIQIAIFFILSGPVASLTIRLLSIKEKKKETTPKNSSFYKPLKMLVIFAGIALAFISLKKSISINAEFENTIWKIIKICMILLVTKAFILGLDKKSSITEKIRLKSNNKVDENTNKMIINAVRVLIYIAAGFLIFSELGFDITGFITGFGLTGIVITLAAQDTAKSLIGGLTIFFDKPYKVGDFIGFDNTMGTVEKIKFRSTIIRTLENDLLHVPNSKMVETNISNYNEMNARRIQIELTLELDTKLEKAKKVEEEIEKMLKANEQIILDTILVKFQRISDNGIDLLVIANTKEINYYKYLAIKENINYSIMEILQNNNVELAYNTQTINVKKTL